LALRWDENPNILFDSARCPNSARLVVHYRTDRAALFDIAATRDR